MQKTNINMEQEIKKFIDQFERQYGHTPERTEFFMQALPELADKVFEKGIDLDKELWGFVNKYKDNGLGGFTATYANLYNWLIDFAALVLGVDEFELRSGLA